MSARLIVGVIAASCAMSLAWGEALSPWPQGLSRGRSFDEQGGEALFARVCAGCHQRDGEGASGAGAYPALARDPDVASADYLETLLFEGQKDMPALGRMMSDKQVADIINYVRSHFGNAYGETVTPDEVEAARRRTQPAP